MNEKDLDGRCGKCIDWAVRYGPRATQWLMRATQQSPKAVTLAKRADQARRLAATNKLTYAQGAAKHLNEYDRRYMHRPQLIQEIMKTKPITDPGNAQGAVAWKAVGTNNGSFGFYELVVHPESGQIYHFVFKSVK